MPRFNDTANTNSASLRKCDRSAHIHECVRREKAFDLQVSDSSMRFCYECMEWFLSSQWRDHCDAHLQSWQTQHCEVIIYRHTIIRPGYCPFCLWDPELFAEDSLRYWLRSDNLREHIEGQHLARIRNCQTKPLCGCSQTFHSERDLRHHLHDAHGLKETIWQNPKLPNKRKRACKGESQAVQQKQKRSVLRKSNSITTYLHVMNVSTVCQKNHLPPSRPCFRLSEKIRNNPPAIVCVTNPA